MTDEKYIKLIQFLEKSISDAESQRLWSDGEWCTYYDGQIDAHKRVLKILKKNSKQKKEEQND